MNPYFAVYIYIYKYDQDLYIHTCLRHANPRVNHAFTSLTVALTDVDFQCVSPEITRINFLPSHYT